jgi:enterochelin esterase-like enzyme
MYPRTFHLLLPWCLCVPFVFAQAPRPPAVVSPEVRGDRTVTFRIYAPKATEVLVTGDWMGRTDKPIPLAKGDDGVWVGATGPLEPNMYFYAFSVDGVRTADPANTNTIVTGGRFPQSGLEIRGEAALLWEVQRVPKGTIHVEFFDSALQGRERSYYVYTPPGYENNRGGSLPVLVLLPGTPGTEADWVTVGLVNRIFDNLIAQKRVKPMLVLMPRADILLRGGTRADNLREFEPLLVREVLPHFESRYHRRSRPDLRAIAGYSLGGELALVVGLRHPNLFGTVGSFGGSVFEKDFEDRFGKAWADPKAISTRYRLIWIGCGSGDLLLPGNRKLSEVLKQKNIQHVFSEIAGYHSTPTFRALLIDFAQVLFR